MNAQRRGQRQGGGEAGDSASEKLKDAESSFGKLKRWIKADYNSKGQVNWRREAREDFDFEAGEQLNEEDKAILQDAKRPIVIFNRVGRRSIASPVRKSAAVGRSRIAQFPIWYEAVGRATGRRHEGSCARRPELAMALQWYDANADNPPWIRALAELRQPRHARGLLLSDSRQLRSRSISMRRRRKATAIIF